MRFEVQQRSLDGTNWEPVGEGEGSGERATATVVEQLGQTAGIYRARPAETDERWAFYVLDASGVAHYREFIP